MPTAAAAAACYVPLFAGVEALLYAIDTYAGSKAHTAGDGALDVEATTAGTHYYYGPLGLLRESHNFAASVAGVF